MPGLEIAFTFAIGMALFGIIAGFVLHRIIGMYIEGAMGGIECLVIAGLYLGLVISIITIPPLRVPLSLLLIAVLVLLPVLTRRSDKKDTHRYNDERMVQFREAIAADPLNLAARSRLAATLQREGRIDEAIAEYSEIMRIAPQSRDEAYRLKLLIQEREDIKEPPVECPSCGHHNHPSRTRCENCEGDLKFSSELKKWLVKGGLKQIAISGGIAVGVITLALFILSMFSFVGRIAVMALVIMIVLLAELIYIHRNY